MSDFEHELLNDVEHLRSRAAHLAELALRALATARDAQDAADGRHEPWLDQAVLDVEAELSSFAPPPAVPGSPH